MKKEKEEESKMEISFTWIEGLAPQPL